MPFYSTVTGELIDGTTLDARYWFDNLRHPVRFDDVIASLVADGHTAFVEVSPHPVLTGGVGERANVVVGTLRRDEGGWDRMLRSAGELWAGGIEVDWPRVLGETTGVVDLPTYPFQRQRFWPSSAGEALLGAGVQLADGDGTVFTGRVSLSTHPWLADHRVLDRVLLPGTAFVELALHAGAVRELTIEAPLVIPDTGSVTLQVRVGALDETGDRPVRISSRSEDSWTHHATGLIAAEAPPSTWSRGPRRAPIRSTWTGSTSVARTLGMDTGQSSRVCVVPGGSLMTCMPRWCCRSRRLRPGSACTRRCWTPPCTP
ncbi:hypothetical protein GCM10027610_000010 [Dactylosporangium cerinum]